jgi:hypothetical protein
MMDRRSRPWFLTSPAIAPLAILFIATLVGCGGSSSNSKSEVTPPPSGPPPVVPVNIEIQPAAPNLNVGANQAFTATEIFSDGSTQDVTGSATWSSTASAVATVSSGGTVTGVTQGAATLTAALPSGSLTGYTILTVGSLPASGGSANFYVAIDGNDTWSGTLPAPNSGATDGPFLTLNRARQAVNGKAGTIVQIRGGTYFLSAPVSFGAADSGSASAPIIYENYPGETPVFSGGAIITGWTNTTGNTWTASIPNTNQNFEGLYYQAAGAADSQRRFRPRTTPTGNSCPASGYLCNAGKNPVTVGTSSTNCTLQISTGYECFDQFYFNPGDVAPSYHAMSLGDVEVLDFEHWSMSRLRLASVDTSNNIAHLTSPTVQGHDYGFLPSHRYLIENCNPGVDGITADPNCSASAGQWYLDRCPNSTLPCSSPQAIWTLTYFANSGENLLPGADTIIVPQSLQVMVGSGASNIIFQGISFAHDNWLPGSVPVPGVPCTGECGLGDFEGIPYASATVSFTNSQNVIFNGCTFAHTQGWALEFVGNDAGTSSNNQVINSLFYDLGAGGVRIGRIPGASGGTDSASNVPKYNLVENNLIDAGGRVQPTGIGTGVWVGNANHNVVAHNEIFDFYSGAIGLGFSYGTGPVVGDDNIAAFNLMYQLGQGVTSDMGGIHAAAGTPPGTMLLNNVIHDVTHDFEDADGYGGNGLYLDASTSYAVAHNNLVYRVSWFGALDNISGTANQTSPQYNVFLNNIVAFSREAVIQRGGDNASSFSFVRNVAYFDMGAPQSGHWTCQDVGVSTTAVPCDQRFQLDYNDYWYTAGPLQFYTTNSNSGVAATYTFAEWQALGEDVHSINQDPMFVAPGYTAGDNYTLQSSSPALGLGFTQIDTSHVGRTNPILNPPMLSCAGVQSQGACEAFPLQTLNPATDY